MKLILKRVGEDRRSFRSAGDGIAVLRDLAPDMRPYGLHTEDGECLPYQMSAVLSSDHAGATLTVVFTVDGDQVSVEGDRRDRIYKPAEAEA